MARTDGYYVVPGHHVTANERQCPLPVKDTRLRFPCGELSLEGILALPEGMYPLPAVIVCHPHPLYGGSMLNNVVNSLYRALFQVSVIPFKFNFRGVGLSDGTFSQGIGEQEDVAAAISFLTTLKEVDSDRIGLAGYSAGAAFALPVACREARIKAIAAVSPPLSMFEFQFLEDCPKPKLLISGSSDDFTPAARFIEFCQKLSGHTEYDTIKGAGHFWWGYESNLADAVAAFFTRVL